MSRPKRESMKGKGLGTFFPEPETEDQASDPQDLQVLPSSDEPEASNATVSLASKQASKQVGSLACMHAGFQSSELIDQLAATDESTLAGLQAHNQAEDGGEELGADISDPLLELWPVLAEPATITNAFRFTNDELERLGDVVYQISKQHSVKVPKQDVVRLALGAMLQEYEREDEESLLGRYVLRRKQWRRGAE